MTTVSGPAVASTNRASAFSFELAHVRREAFLRGLEPSTCGRDLLRQSLCVAAKLFLTIGKIANPLGGQLGALIDPRQGVALQSAQLLGNSLPSLPISFVICPLMLQKCAFR